jgi:hypothetical protein
MTSCPLVESVDELIMMSYTSYPGKETRGKDNSKNSVTLVVDLQQLRRAQFAKIAIGRTILLIWHPMPYYSRASYEHTAP